MEDSSKDRDIDTKVADLSESKNPYGVGMKKARPVGLVIAIITGIAFFNTVSYSLSWGLSLARIVLLWVIFVLFGTSVKFAMSEKESGKFKIWVQQLGGGLDSYQPDHSMGPTKSVCRECREEISPDVKRCPHCGWKPKKRGGLWWGATALMSFNPIGWAMGAKGASDNIKASKGVTEETTVSSDEAPTEDTARVEETPTEKLERLNELRKEDVISEEEFEAKKKELLEQI